MRALVNLGIFTSIVIIKKRQKENMMMRKPIKLYHFDKAEIVPILSQQEVLYADPSKVEQDFKRCYIRLSKKLESCIPRSSEQCQLPWWAWYITDYDSNGNPIYKPNIRESGHMLGGTESVLLTLEIPDDEVFLFSFDYWHVWLNTADSCNEEFLQNMWSNIYHTNLKDLQRKREAVQAVFWHLRWSNVKEIEYFTAP